MQTIIQNGTVYTNGQLIPADVLITDQTISAIGAHGAFHGKGSSRCMITLV